MKQIASAEQFVFEDGRMDGVRGCRVKNGSGLEYCILMSNCLDLYSLTYKGINMSFLSKPGVLHPSYFNVHGYEYHRFFHGGMLYTCGIGNIGAACTEGEREYNFHGRISQTPAEQVSVVEGWENGRYRIEVSGKMREASHYGENLVLHRTITTYLGEKKLKIKDIVTNEGYESEAVMLLYHMNFGYPFVDEGARIILPKGELFEKQLASEQALKQRNVVSGAVDEMEADIFYHRPNCDRDGYSYAGIVNEKLGICMYEKYQTQNLPMLVQWKSMRNGEYAVSLEPCSQFPENRMVEGAKNALHYLEPFESAEFEIEMQILDNVEEIAAFEEMVSQL